SIPANNIILENALAGLKANIGTIENIEIQVKGSRAALEKLTEAPKVFVDLQNYTTAGTITVPLQAELPPGCTLVGNVTVPVVLTGQQK
ncbi:MAG: CdaR family protein, partial [Bacillota bacterium]|nr:CdaR family protein [Bacillota bacterium]